MSWVHKVDRFTFQFWDGDRPRMPTTQVQTFSRPGVDSHDVRLTGTRAEVTECQLTEHLVNWNLRAPLLRQYRELVGRDAVEVWYEQRRLLVTDRVLFLVLAVDEVDCQTNVRLVGPGYDYPNGASLVTRWRLLAIAQQ